MSSLRCLHVEDTDAFRDGLNRFGIDVVAQARDFGGAVELLDTPDLDVLLVDLGIPGVCRFDTVVALRQAMGSHQLPIVAYSVSMDVQTAAWAIADGALAAHQIPAPLPLLARSLWRAADGIPSIEPDLAQWALDANLTRVEQRPGTGSALPSGGQRALELIAQGDVDVERDLALELHATVRRLFLSDAQRDAIEAVARTSDPAQAAALIGVRPDRVTELLAEAHPVLLPSAGYGELDPTLRPATAVMAWVKEQHVCGCHGLVLRQRGQLSSTS